MKRDLTGYYKGVIAEYICVLYLWLRGHKIVARRLKTPVGEIDILTKRRNIMYAVEVKYRSSSLDDAKFALLKSRKRVKMAYKWWSVGRNKNPIEFKYFVCSGFRFEVGSM
jgi:putative endonuclease